VNIVIVGAGEVGRHLAESLSNQQHNICVIEQSEKLVQELNERLDAQILCSNGSSAATLAEANVPESDLFLALTSDDTTNLVAASLAKAMGARKTIARVHSQVQRAEWLFDYKTHFGIDYLFSSERLAAVELAKFVRNPERLMVEELARGRIEVQQTRVSAESKAAGRKIAELQLPARIRIATVERQGAVTIPDGQQTLEPDDLVTLFGEPLKLTEVLPLFNPEQSNEDHVSVIIFGGGEYGFALAQMLEGSKRIHVRILEQDPKLCRELSNTLQSTVVIQGDATSLQLLREEQAGAADFFIAVTDEDEDNVMTCLQARNLGTKYCLALIHRADYATLVDRNSELLGIRAAVSPRVATSRDLLRFVTSDKFHVMLTLGDGAELIEMTVPRTSEVAGQKVSEIKWPAGTGLVALIQGTQAVVPIGDDQIQGGDTLYAVVSSRAKKPFVRLLG
jgi:trk system potassium uptake protein